MEDKKKANQTASHKLMNFHDNTIQKLEEANKNEAKCFLRMLDPQAETFTYQAIQKLDSGQSKAGPILHGPIDEHYVTLKRLNEAGYCVFVVINETDGKGRKAENITRVRAVFVDLDGAPLQPVLDAEPPPHIVVNTSPDRYHAYWLVSDMPLEGFEKAQGALIKRFDGDSSVKDLPRLMRLPGFFNLKGVPFNVTMR